MVRVVDDDVVVRGLAADDAAKRDGTVEGALAVLVEATRGGTDRKNLRDFESARHDNALVAAAVYLEHGERALGEGSAHVLVVGRLDDEDVRADLAGARPNGCASAGHRSTNLACADNAQAVAFDAHIARARHVGQQLHVGDAKIAQDLRRIQIEAQVNEADIGSISEGNSVVFSVDAYPERKFEGRVSQVRLAATELQNIVTYAVIIEAANDDRRLFPGMTANVEIETDKRDGILRVTNDALRYRPRGGALVNWLFVRRDVERIFQYRQQRMKEIFGGEPT